MIPIDCFKNLIQTYPTWPLLKEYLESTEGGSLHVSEPNEQGLCLIHYDKVHNNNGSGLMNAHPTWFRSVVWNTVEHYPVCVAPPKTCAAAFPCTTMQDAIDQQMVCEELLDGFMINCVHVAGTLFITSRSKLDATGRFYSPKTFRQLFAEAYLGETFESTEAVEAAIAGIQLGMPDADKDEVAVCHSFLVQHVEHRVVTPIYQSRVHRIHTATFYKDGGCQLEQHGQPLSVLSADSAMLVTDWVHQLFQTKSWDFQGIVWKDSLGHRWRVRSEKYMAVRSLRGNHASTVERFSQMYTQHIVPTYLQYYLEDSVDVAFYGFMMSQLISIVHHYYIGLHVAKTMALADIDKMYHPHLYHLHGEYVTLLRPAGKNVRKEVVQQYFHRQPWQRLVFLLKKHKAMYFEQLGQAMTQIQSAP